MLKHNPHALATSVPDLGDLDYRVQGLLATDSKMSEILLATDPKGQTVILKIACVQQRVRAETNRRAIHNSVLWLQQLRDHAGIARLQPIRRKGQQGPRAWVTPPTFIATLPAWPEQPDFLITEYLAGGTLSSFVGKRPLPVDLALTLAYDLAQTVAYLHEHQCVHRDLKPENVLFRTLPVHTATPGALQPVLIDFGVAARIGEPKLISGSRLWMAPELQAAHEKSPLPVDPAWDVYALGLICCYMLSGRRPVRRQHDYQDYMDYRDQVFALLQQEAADADAEWQQVVAALQKLLTRTLDRDPRRRPTATALAEALGTLLLKMDISPPKHEARLPQWVPLAPPDWRKTQKHWRWVGLIFLIILGFAFLTAILGSQAASDPPVVTPAVDPPGAPATPVVIQSAAALLPTAYANQMIQTKLATPLPTTTLPPPTLAPLPTTPTQAIPTLASAQLTGLAAPPPTLIRLTPTLMPTATTAPTRPLPTATATPLPTTRSAVPTATPAQSLPTATRQPQPTAVAFATIRLLTPLPNGTAAQARVEFAWEVTGAALAPDHCYELVFWDPAKSRDKRSPIGAGRATKGLVNFQKLSNSPDPLLQALARTPQGFAWGVRFVSCAAPKTILQDVNDVRHYTYQP